MRVTTDSTVIAGVGVTVCVGINQALNIWGSWGRVLLSLGLRLGYLHGPGLAPDGVDPVSPRVGVLPNHSAATCIANKYYDGRLTRKHSLQPEFLA